MTLQNAYEICCEKARVHMKNMNTIPLDLNECIDGNYYADEINKVPLSNRYTWLASFVTGMAPLLFQTTGDVEALEWANQFKECYREKVIGDLTPTMHDIGFLYLPYSVHLYMLTGDLNHRETALMAATELGKRFDVNGRFIEAWQEMNDPGICRRIIADTLMNLGLLFWAWKETGHRFYLETALAHLETNGKILIRDDYSVCHSWLFDGKNGKPQGEDNCCGYSNGSHWARGTAWQVFGYALAYDYTKDESYLELAIRIVQKYMKCLDDGPIPVWDFCLPKDKPAAFCGNTHGRREHWDETLTDNKKYNVDTSAAAIMACALQIIGKHRNISSFAEYVENTLQVLSDEYLNTDISNPGMLYRSNGRDMFTIYGDYYYMLALAMKVHGIKTCWELFE